MGSNPIGATNYGTLALAGVPPFRGRRAACLSAFGKAVAWVQIPSGLREYLRCSFGFASQLLVCFAVVGLRYRLESAAYRSTRSRRRCAGTISAHMCRYGRVSRPRCGGRSGLRGCTRSPRSLRSSQLVSGSRSSAVSICLRAKSALPVSMCTVPAHRVRKTPVSEWVEDLARVGNDPTPQDIHRGHRSSSYLRPVGLQPSWWPLWLPQILERTVGRI